MTPDGVKAVVGDLRWMTVEQGRAITAFIREHSVRTVLELGFHHGVSTSYLAAALEAAGGGSLTTIDLEHTRQLSPSVEQLLDRLGLTDGVTVHYEPSSYTWRLMKMLDDDPTPRFDLCFVDAAHSWQVDGLGFFLADRLLHAGGWIVFDDVDWRAGDYSHAYADEPWYRSTPREELETAQVRKVYELLVKTHPGYGEFRTEDGWAYARKLRHEEASSIRTETVVKPVPVPSELIRRDLAQRRARRATDDGS